MSSLKATPRVMLLTLCRIVELSSSLFSKLGGDPNAAGPYHIIYDIDWNFKEEGWSP